ncbi:MAG: hypothetical protein KGL48_08205 [Sphingomonadales bacterium]|nr:hypothetical protein [Sphingomonadales bacterium]MDE2568864.1 hypothetical protein [Sphingomonadales bacterium]
MNRSLSRVCRGLATVALVLAPAALAPCARAEEPAVPYWASMSKDKANVRVGPGFDYRISWVYQRRGLPVKVVRTMGGWRLIEDPDGTRGWLLSRFLSRTHTAIVIGKHNAEMHEGSDGGGRLLWRVEPGVVGIVGDCDSGWCRFEVGARKGYIRADAIWGS